MSGDAAEALGLLCGAFGVVVGLPLLWAILTYNRFARLGQHVKESWSGVDVELKRRHDLVPNLVETVKGYAKHERETLEMVVAARAKAMAAGEALRERVDGESELGRSLGRLIALSESYPELKSDRHFLELQRELSLTEDRIAASRRFYNSNVRELNSLRIQFPSNLVAGAFGFREERFFELEDPSERAAPRV
ncbi:MAG: LemA family protein [Planctomycetota bacterium]|nr:LemA family protein [Planctomycetota bacterium]